MSTNSLDERPIIIAGPTASGKSLLAAKIANKLGSVVINADSRQVYRQMAIGTSMPTEQEFGLAPHYLFDLIAVEMEYDVADYLQSVAKLLHQYQWTNPVFCGGSGLYIKALYMGLTAKVNPSIRIKLEQELAQNGLQYLVERLLVLDGAKGSAIDLNNPRRVVRALEVILTEEPAAHVSAVLRNPLLIALDLEREELYQRINQRCEQMIEAGFLKEVEALFPYRHLKSLQTIGYKEFFLWKEGVFTFDEALEKMKQHTRNYAKRQLTWFRNQGEFVWLKPDQVEDFVLSAIAGV